VKSIGVPVHALTCPLNDRREPDSFLRACRAAAGGITIMIMRYYRRLERNNIA
jgi:hypothetical protein